MKAGKGMSNEFMIHVGMESHARLVSEWAHYKSWAETQADENESLRRQLAAMRRGLQQLIGAPDVPQLSDAELFTLLGEALAVDDREDSDPVGAEQPRGYVGYSEQPDAEPSLIVGLPPEMSERVKSWPSFSIDVETLPGERMGDALARGLRSIPVRAPGESPWLAPPQDGPPAPDHQYDAITYAKMVEHDKATPGVARCAELVGDSVCGARVTDGHCPEHGDVGPPTVSMPTVEEPPNVHGLTGEVITDRDSLHDMPEWPALLANRAAEVYEYERLAGVIPVYRCHAVETSWTLPELLTMHGTLWVVDPNAGAATGEQVSGE